MPRRKKKGWFSGWTLKRVRIGLRGALPEIGAEWERVPAKKRRPPTRRRIEAQVARRAPRPSRGPKPVQEEILETVQKEGVRTFKESLHEGDFATAAISAYVSLLAEQQRKKKPPT